MTFLTNRTINSEKEVRASVHQTNQSTKQSKEILAKIQVCEREMMTYKQQLSSQCNTIIDLEHKLNVAIKELTRAKDAVPIKIFGKVCQGNRGNPCWSLHVWELIIEQIVNGTPPCGINGNIVT